jgi:hypothetical protein
MVAATLLVSSAGACIKATSFSVTEVTADVRPASATKTCPRTFIFTGHVKAGAAGRAVYRWERSDGITEPPHTAHFSAPGTATVVSTWTVGATTGGWMQLHVLEPVDLRSERAAFSVECASVALAATARVSPVSSRRCAQVFELTGAIAVSGPVTLTYEWRRSDGAAMAKRRLRFAAAGTQTVHEHWTVAAAQFSGWARVDVLTPNVVVSNKAAFTKTGGPCS